MTNIDTIEKLYLKIIELDQKRDSPFSRPIFDSVQAAVTRKAPLEFLVFTCSTINSQYLFSNQPWKYISLQTKNNNLEPDIGRLAGIIKELKKIYPRVDFKILIGNTDPYYIYLEQFKNFPVEKRAYLRQMFASRWKIYQQKLQRWAIKQGSLKDIKVLSWYELERQADISFESQFNVVLKKIDRFFTAADFKWEFRQISKQFRKGKYFARLNRPAEGLLKEWIKRKFSEYCLQGQWIYELFPGAILIQNEKPSDLRSRMYQPLIERKYKAHLPIVHFLGIDNSGYQ